MKKDKLTVFVIGADNIHMKAIHEVLHGKKVLSGAQLDFQIFSNIEDCQSQLLSKEPHAIIADSNLDGINGVDFVKLAQITLPKIKGVIMSSEKSAEKLIGPKLQSFQYDEVSKLESHLANIEEVTEQQQEIVQVDNLTLAVLSVLTAAILGLGFFI